MAARVQLKKRVQGSGNYFASPKTVKMFSTGCKTLDLALGGGGWAEKRVGNIIGDKSTGKTLLCIEASANFLIKYPKGKVRYREFESAFDRAYADALGMPVDRVDFGHDPIDTIEALFEDLFAVCKAAKQPELYIIDSLDAISDAAELDRGIDEGSFGAQKAKKLSELFRRLVRELDRANVTLLIVSQVRDNIGVKFGRKWRRACGRALDFYASQALYLAQTGKLTSTVSKVKLVTGVKIKALVDKNKVGLPFRTADFSIMFGYGIDDVAACVDYLKATGGGLGRDNEALSNMREAAFFEMCDEQEGDWKKCIEQLHNYVEARWYEIESGFLPKKRKYA